MTDRDTILQYGTLLTFDIGIPPYSCRNATQTLGPIAQTKQTRRTLNGAMRDISQPEFRKYGSVISCTDQSSPALAGVWPGRVVMVDCTVELGYRTLDGDPTPRTAVPGSTRVEGEFTFYKPRLEMMITDLAPVSRNEWSADVTWAITLEEVS